VTPFHTADVMLAASTAVSVDSRAISTVTVGGLFED